VIVQLLNFLRTEHNKKGFAEAVSFGQSSSESKVYYARAKLQYVLT